MAEKRLLEIDLRPVEAAVVVELDGELDLASAPDLRARLLELVNKRPELVVLDLSKLSFVDSTGISLFVVAHQRFAESGIPFRLAGATPAVRRLLEITKLDELFSLYDAPDAALETPAS